MFQIEITLQYETERTRVHGNNISLPSSFKLLNFIKVEFCDETRYLFPI